MIKNTAKFVAIVMFFFGVGGVAAAEGTFDSVTADELEAALAEAGLGPVMMEDEMTGAPVASGEAGSFRFFVRSLSCSGTPAACSELIFFANFDLGRAITDEDYRVINGFNDSQVFGRAYIIEAQDQVGVDYVIELGGGVTADHLAENIGRWADVIGAFVDDFRKGHAGS
ncbi:MAG: YbjN domain-containing protein [Pseudomonadota bacterium]